MPTLVSQSYSSQDGRYLFSIKSINCISSDTTCSGDVGMKEEGRATESGAALTFLQLGRVQWESWLLWIEHGSVEHLTGS